MNKQLGRVIALGLGAYFVLFIFITIMDNMGKKPQPVTAPVAQVQEAPKPKISDIDVYQLYKLTNDERVKAGVAPLSLNPLLEQSAKDKCDDMAIKGYWSHNTPDGARPWVFIGKYIPHYFKVGENLAEGFPTDKDTVAGWMNSPGHKRNLLDSEFTQVGYAVCSYKVDTAGPKKDSLIVVQHLLRP